ncbi:DUF6745 domain-containing protein [Williamsia phyllosphaerae]|nr:hypothetical protein [Williamsia phyllosphaerae]
MSTMGRADVVSISIDSLDGAPTRIAHMLSASRTRMNARIAGAHRTPWGERQMTAIPGVPSWRVSEDTAMSAYQFLRASIWDSLHTSLFDGVAAAIRTLMPPFVGAVTWYGQQEAHRVAYYDYYRRSRLAMFRPEDLDLLAVLATLTRATGWWWAFDDVCVMAERPTALHTETAPNGQFNQQRLHRDDEPAIEFTDGQQVFAHHGTIIPAWVVREPTVERIARERNVEVRRCAIERIGWDTYVDTAGLDEIDQADDPGNTGNRLRLYTTPDGWGRRERILLVVNGSTERDGQRRRYGLRVPPWIGSALDAAGWTYGIRGSDYARLARRT